MLGRSPRPEEGWVILRASLVALQRYLVPRADWTGLLYHLGPTMPYHEYIQEQLETIKDLVVLRCRDVDEESLRVRIQSGLHTAVVCTRAHSSRCTWSTRHAPSLRQSIPSLQEIALEASPIETESWEETQC